MTTSLSLLIFSADKLELWFPVKIYLLLVTRVGVGGLLSELFVVTLLKLDLGVMSCEIVRPFFVKACVDKLFSISGAFTDFSFFPRNISKSYDQLTLFSSLYAKHFFKKSDAFWEIFSLLIRLVIEIFWIDLKSSFSSLAVHGCLPKII